MKFYLATSGFSQLSFEGVFCTQNLSRGVVSIISAPPVSSRLAIPTPHRPELFPVAREPRLQVGAPKARVHQRPHSKHPKCPREGAQRPGPPQHHTAGERHDSDCVAALEPAHVHFLRAPVRPRRHPVGHTWGDMDEAQGQRTELKGGTG